jgi:predicted lipid-binding transport protein (Tim44 family)
MTPERRAQALGYAAGAAGVLSFIWGFLNWYNGSTAGYSVLGGGAGATIGLSIVAGGLAAARAYENKAPSVEPFVLSLAAFLIALGIIIGKGSTDAFGGGDVGTGVGLILQLITSIIQAAILGYAWMAATGRLPAPRPHHPTQQWQQPGSGYQPPTAQFQQQPAQQPAPPQYQQQPPPGYEGPPPGYQPPPPPHQ